MLHVLHTAQLKEGAIHIMLQDKNGESVWYQEGFVGEDFYFCNHKHGYAMKNRSCPTSISS